MSTYHAFSILCKKMIDWEGTHNGNATEMSGSNFFLQNIIENAILVYAFVTRCNMFMSKAYKTDHKKLNLAATFKRKRTMSLCPISFLSKSNVFGVGVME